MATVEPIRGDWPQVTIRIETSGNLDLGNASRLLQRINTGIHRAYPGAAPRVEIVALETGSIQLRVAILSAALTAAQLAVQISDHLQNEPAAARSCRQVFDHDNGNQIIIVGGRQNITVAPENIGDDDYDYGVAARVAAGPRPAPPPPRGVVSIAEGVFEGTVERISGEYYIQLTDRPGLFLRIEDERDDPANWQEHQSYRVEGRAYFAPVGKPSAFIVESAMQL